MLHYCLPEWRNLTPKALEVVADPLMKEVPNPWRQITQQELEAHADVDNKDAWISIRGIVYDVSEYAEKHPGGIDKIRKYAGTDATEVFDTVHVYVKVAYILEDNRIGVLKGHPAAPKQPLCSNLKCMESRYISPTTSFKQDSIVATYIVDFSNHCEDHDWTVGVTDKEYLHVYKCYDRRKGWLSVYKLPERLINNEIDIEYKRDYKLAYIILRKPIPGTSWAMQMHGLHDCGRFVSLHKGHSKFDAFIIYKKCLTPTVLLFGIQITNSAQVRVPIGFHVNIHIGDICRPYTPVCLSIIDEAGLPSWKHRSNKVREAVLFFMIKIYSKGALTRALDDIPEDVGMEVPTLKISTPYGYFHKEFLRDFTTLLLVAGGSGISPMIRILKEFWAVSNRIRGKRVALIYFCDKVYQLIWRNEFTMMQENSTWFYYFPVLTRPSEQCKWKGHSGTITTELVNQILAEIDDRFDHKNCKVCICGPPGFNQASVNSLKDFAPRNNIHVFSN